MNKDPHCRMSDYKPEVHPFKGKCVYMLKWKLLSPCYPAELMDHQYARFPLGRFDTCRL